jgi:hypothetical protein
MADVSGVQLNFSSKLALKGRLRTHHGSRISCLNLASLFGLFVSSDLFCNAIEKEIFVIAQHMTVISVN